MGHDVQGASNSYTLMCHTIGNNTINNIAVCKATRDVVLTASSFYGSPLWQLNLRAVNN